MYFIDVSQSVEPSHPHGLEFLHRDCENISNFFSSRIGKDTDTEVMQPHELFTHITGAKKVLLNYITVKLPLVLSLIFVQCFSE